LLPELGRAAYRAVAPFNRGFAPTELPADRHHVHTSTMVADVLALHEALGGDQDAILIAHDWGAVAAWDAAGRRPLSART
jgi:pimeloyl-ACP methyl ester carboxylesterase